MKMSAHYSPCEAHGIVTEDKDVSSHFCVVSIVKLTNPLALPGFLACFRSPPNRDTSSRGLSDLREFTLFESDVEEDRNLESKESYRVHCAEEYEEGRCLRWVGAKSNVMQWRVENLLGTFW